MFSLILLVLAAGDNFYQGGVAPTALKDTRHVDPGPSIFSCSTETLKTSSTCVFDGRPATSADPKAQATANMAFVAQLGASLCKQRLEKSTLEEADRGPRLKACQERVKKMSPVCTIDGKEGLVDAEGRFAPGSKACYLAMAEALQRLDVPTPPAEPKKPAEAP